MVLHSINLNMLVEKNSFSHWWLKMMVFVKFPRFLGAIMRKRPKKMIEKDFTRTYCRWLMNSFSLWQLKVVASLKSQDLWSL